MRDKTETLDELKVLTTVDSRGGEHVVGNGRIGSAFESSFAVVTEYAAPTREADECLGVNKSVDGDDAAEFIVGEFGQIFVGRAWNGVQHIYGRGLNTEFPKIETHVDAVFHRFTEAHDAAAANFEACGKCVLQRADFGIVGVRGANVRKMPAVSFQVVVESGEACLFQLFELVLVQKPCRKADGKFRFFFQAADCFANLLHVAVRKGAARGHDGVTGDSSGFFFLGVFYDFVGREQLVFRCASVVVAALGTIFAVFGTASAAGVHDGAKIKVVPVESFADFVCRSTEFVEVFVKQFYRFFTVDVVAA